MTARRSYAAHEILRHLDQLGNDKSLFLSASPEIGAFSAFSANRLTLADECFQ